MWSHVGLSTPHPWAAVQQAQHAAPPPAAAQQMAAPQQMETPQQGVAKLPIIDSILSPSPLGLYRASPLGLYRGAGYSLGCDERRNAKR